MLGGAGALEADETAEEQARAVESLHAFGVRGLPSAYKDTAEAKARLETIQLGLQWLAAHQAPDGSWQPDELHWCNGEERKDGAPDGPGKKAFTAGVTGLAVSAFLGAGYTHRGNHPFAQAVRKGLTWLVKAQDKEGCVGARNSPNYVYCHAFGSLALVEAYALTGDPLLREPTQLALDFSALARNPFFAWRYGVKPGDNDTSITGCMGMPLYVALRLNQAGERADVFEPIGVDDTVFDGIRRWLDKMVDEDYGRVGYMTRGSGPARPLALIDEFPGEKSEACTAISIFLRTVLPGFENTREDAARNKDLIKKGVKLMRGLEPAWTVDGGNIDLYYWYYASMAMRQVGGAAWKSWDEALTKALISGQNKSGDACGLRGSWDPVSAWSKEDGGRIYATAICLLSLETPDRMHPLPEDRTDLLDALATKNLTPERRASILRGLGMLAVPGAGGAIAKWVSDDEEQVRVAAAEALGHMDAGTAGVRVLVGVLDDPRPSVRRAVVRALAAQGPHLKRAVTPLLARLDDEDEEVAAGAAHALGFARAPEAVDPLRARMQGGSPVLRVSAAAAVYRLTQDADGTLPVLIEGLKAAKAGVRVRAAEALASFSSGLDAAVPALATALTDDTPRVRIHAAATLLRIGKEKAALIDALINSLSAPLGTDRLLAMEALEGVGTPKATPALTKQLLSGPTRLRIQAAKTLAAAGPGARPAAARLFWCSKNGPSALRKVAGEAFKALEMTPEAAAEHVVPVLEDTSADERDLEGAVEVLAAQGKGVVPAVIGSLERGNEQAKSWSLDVLKRLGPKASAAVPSIAREMY
ncbi:MAG: HEAT repeat domain-containing protein, partial [Planctomycetota bacterium]|nr:HEAT repeat domain-containing protein [Planctomycetota bacterium]